MNGPAAESSVLLQPPRETKARLNVLPFCAAVILAVTVVDKVFQNTVSAKQLAWTAWSYSDWLINYSAGFVRRGLGGEIMQAIWSPERFLANLNLYLFIQFLAFTLLFTGLFVRVSGLNRALLLALAMPGGVYNMAWTNEFFHRKEMLFNLFLVAVACIVCIPTSLVARKTAWSAAVFVSVLAFLVLPLVHESFVFLTATPAICLLIVSSPGNSIVNRSRLAWALFAVAILQFAVATFFKGNAEIAQAIWKALPPRLIANLPPSIPVQAPFGAVSGIGWTIGHALSLPWRIVVAGKLWYWFVPVGIAMAGLAVMWNDIQWRRPARSAGPMVAVVAAIFLAATPLYVLGWDWGRWISSSTIASQICMLVVAHRSGDADTSTDAGRVGGGANSALFYLITLVSLTLTTPECCM